MLKINQDIVFFPHENGAILYDQKRQTEFSVGKTEWSIIEYLQANEVKSVEQIAVDAEKKSKCEIVEALRQNQIIESKIKNAKKFRRTICLLNYERMKKTFFCAGKLSPFIMALFPIALLTAVFSFFIHPSVSFFDMKMVLSKENIMFCYLGIFMSLFLHEIYHAIIARKIGAHIVEMGVQLNLMLGLSAYLRIVGMSLCSTRQKVAIYAGGIYSHMTMVPLLLALRSFCNHQSQTYFFLTVVCVSNLVLIAINSLPVFKLDGHRIYQEILGIKSFGKYVKALSTLDAGEKTIVAIASLVSVLGVVCSKYMDIQTLGVSLYFLCLIIISAMFASSKRGIASTAFSAVFYTAQGVAFLQKMLGTQLQKHEVVASFIAFLIISNAVTLITVTAGNMLFRDKKERGK